MSQIVEGNHAGIRCNADPASPIDYCSLPGAPVTALTQFRSARVALDPSKVSPLP